MRNKKVFFERNDSDEGAYIQTRNGEQVSCMFSASECCRLEPAWTVYSRRIYFACSYDADFMKSTTSSYQFPPNHKLYKYTFSCSLGAEPPLIGGFGLLNDFLPLFSVLDTG